MYKLACFIPKVLDSTSWYRALGPIGHLTKKYRKLECFAMDRTSWASLASIDAVFFQRPSSRDQVESIQIAKEMGLKVWVDYDDLLTAVPADNPTYETYGKSEVQKNIIMSIGLADHVTVSTNALADAWRPINKNITVIRNALHTQRIDHYRNSDNMPKRNNLILWRGSRTHQRDVMTYAPAIIEASKSAEAEKWVWHFIGDNPWFMTMYMPHKNTVIGESLDVLEYHRHIYETAPSCLHVPLHDCLFNRSKSNISWIEASFAGCPAIVPDWPEWQRAGVLKYTDMKSYRANLMAVVKGEVDVAKLAKEAWEDVMQNFTLDTVNHLRAEVIAAVMGIEPKDLL